MKKLSSKQVQKINEFSDRLRYFGFSNVQVNFDSHWVITAERDFLTTHVIRCIPRNMDFIYSNNELSICLREYGI